MDQPVVFNRDALLKRLDGDEELIEQIIDIFLEHAPGQFERLHQAIREGNAAMVKLHAHSLKGAAANMEAAAMRDVALEIERHSADVRRVAPLVAELEGELHKLQRLLSSLRVAEGAP